MRNTPIAIMDIMKCILEDIEQSKINYHLLPTTNKVKTEYIGSVQCIDNIICTLLIKEITRCGACMLISINLQHDEINICCVALCCIPFEKKVLPDYFVQNKQHKENKK